MNIEQLYEAAMNAISKLFNNTSASPSETKEALNELITEIQIMLNALEADEERMQGDE